MPDVTVKVAVADVLFAEAVTVAVVVVVTDVVVAVKVPVVAPADTVTLAGTVTLVLLLLRLTENPPVGATEESVTVPVEEELPETELGLNETLETVGALTVKGAVPLLEFTVAVTVAVTSAETAVVVAVKVVLLEPDGTITEAGATTLALLLLSVTVCPLDPALPVSVTVPVEDVPPGTLVGLKLSDEKVGALTIRFAVLLVLEAVAVIVAVVFPETAIVVIVKVALVAPAATVTVAGAVAAALLLLSATESPPVGAALLIVTVPVEVLPPITVVGETERAVTVGAVTVKVADLVTALKVPLIVTGVSVATAVVVAVKVPVVAPAAIVTEDGVVTEVELLERLTTKPPVGAAEPMVAVPVDEAPPATLVGDTLIEDSVGGLTVKVAV
ncbi:MAG TPA: hypothetical protein VG944_07015 [Fimbriimonas sp.]|nr:hypothetical protein [Fimbriimonas sp.]